MASHCASESAAASARISSRNRSRLSSVEIRLVDQLEGHPRLDQRVVHPQHVIAGPIGRRHAGVILLGLFREEQRHPRNRRLVAQVALVTEVPVVDPFDHRQPATVVEHAGKLGHPRPHAVGRALGDPQLDLRRALHRVLPAVPLFDADAEDAANRPAAHYRPVLLRAMAVGPRRRQATPCLVVGELDVGQLASGLQIRRAVGDEPRGWVHGRARSRPSASTGRSTAWCATPRIRAARLRRRRRAAGRDRLPP